MDEHSAADQQRLKLALSELDAELVQMIENLKEATETVELDQGQQGRLSRIDAMQAQKMALAQQNRARVRLTRVRNILETAHEDDFGCCGECCEPIPMKRLLARPDSVLCIECAAEREHR
jgi:DnaK suppressor protein